MKIKIAVAELSRVLKQASAVVQGKVTIEVLKYIKVDINGANAVASASDLGMSIIQSFSLLGSDGNGSMLLPAHKIQEILASLPSTVTDATIEQTEKGLTFKAGKHAAIKLPTLPADQFPEIELRPATKLTLKLGTLKQLIRRVETAVIAKESKFVSPVIHVEGTESFLRVVATDGFRISVAEAPSAGVFELNIPKTVLPLIKELTAGESGDVEFSETESKYFFATPKETVLISKSVAKFPPYQRVMGTVFPTSAAASSTDLHDTVNFVNTVTDKSDPRIVLTVGDNQIHFNSASVDGEADNAIEVVLKGAPIKLTLNPDFILDYLSQTEGEATTIEFSTERGAVLFSTGPFYKYYLMPIQPKAAEKKA